MSIGLNRISDTPALQIKLASNIRLQVKSMLEVERLLKESCKHNASIIQPDSIIWCSHVNNVYLNYMYNIDNIIVNVNKFISKVDIINEVDELNSFIDTCFTVVNNNAINLDFKFESDIIYYDMLEINQ